MTSSNSLLDSTVIFIPSMDCDLMLGICAMFDDVSESMRRGGGSLVELMKLLKREGALGDYL